MKNLFSPVFLACALFIGPSSSAISQVISETQFSAYDVDKIRIQYLFSTQYGQEYDVKVLVSTDGGYKYIEPHSITGDVGVLKSSGRKSIVWNVLEDVEEFEAANCKVKVVAEKYRSPLSLVDEFIFGDDEFKNRVNGLTMYGAYGRTNYTNAAYKKLVANGNISNPGAFFAGFSFGYSPITLKIDAFWSTFQYQGAHASDTANIGQSGFNVAATTALFPIANTVVLFGGVGYQASSLFIGESADADGVSRVSTDAAYAVGGVDIFFLKNFLVAADYKLSLTNPLRGWNQISVTVGYIINLNKN